MNQNIQPQNKSLAWIIFTIEANIATIAIFIGFSQIFFSFLPGGFLQSQIGKILLSITILLLMSVWSTRLGVAPVLKRAFVRQEDILRISFWVGFIPFLLGMGLFILGKITIPNFKLSSPIIDSIFSAISYGFFTYFWLKRLNLKNQLEAPAVVIHSSVGSQLKKGLIIGLILVSALVAYAFLGQALQQKAIDKLLKSENRNEIINESLKQFLPPSDNSASETAACQDEPEGAPVIASLSSYSGPVGAKIEIRGCNFSGFEGNLNVYIENSSGIKGIIYGESDSNNNLIKLTLPPSLCQIDTSYSGLPCPAFLDLLPGVYKIYVTPWGKKSNEVIFTVK